MAQALDCIHTAINWYTKKSQNRNGQLAVVQQIGPDQLPFRQNDTFKPLIGWKSLNYTNILAYKSLLESQWYGNFNQSKNNSVISTVVIRILWLAEIFAEDPNFCHTGCLTNLLYTSICSCTCQLFGFSTYSQQGLNHDKK